MGKHIFSGWNARLYVHRFFQEGVYQTMSLRKNKKIYIQEKLEHKILHGLACEWEIALWVLNPSHQENMKKPFIVLKDMKNRLGCWYGEKNEIALNRNFVLNHPWDSVREVFLHEIAHQFAEQVLGAHDEPPHGPMFQKACHLLRANPKASGNYRSLWDQISHESRHPKDKIMLRVKKLMALAESSNQYEAESAMTKAYELISKYNIDLLAQDEKRNFISVFIGKPALRHFREVYHLARLILDFYFVKGIWVPAYVIEKGKMGRVLEVTGTLENVKISVYVYNFIRRFIDSQWDEYNNDKGLNRYRKTDFAVGIIQGFRSKLETQLKKNKPPINKFELVKAEDPLLKDYVAYRYPNTRNMSKNASNQDENILQDGIRVGKKLIIYKGVTHKREDKGFLIENKKS